MSKVFIAWSGNLPLAKAVAAEINRNSRGYRCIIGGNSQNDAGGMFVGGTVIEQMKQCDQAILLVEKHPIRKTVSANLMFEWGYVLSRLSPKKVHDYFIDISQNDEALPSDLHGVWAAEVKRNGRTDGEVAKEIAEQFALAQRNIISGNKMSIIMEWYKTKDYVQRQVTSPICSDYEMAQYLICYTYSAHIFTNIAGDVEMDLQTLAAECKTFYAGEMELALKGARNSLRLFKCIKSTGSDIYLATDDYFELKKIYQNILEIAEGLEESEVKRYILAVFRNFVAFIYLLMLYNNEITPKMKQSFADKLIEESEKVIADCNSIEAASPDDNREFCELLRAYMWRGMFCALDKIKAMEAAGELPPNPHPEERELKIREYLSRSFHERRALYRRYQGENVNGVFFETLEMEYYLALAECRLYEEDEFSRMEMKEELSRYITKAEKNTRDKTVFLNKIGGYIQETAEEGER